MAVLLVKTLLSLLPYLLTLFPRSVDEKGPPYLPKLHGIGLSTATTVTFSLLCLLVIAADIWMHISTKGIDHMASGTNDGSPVRGGRTYTHVTAKGIAQLVSGTSNDLPVASGRALSPSCLQSLTSGPTPVRFQTALGSSSSCADRFDLLMGSGEAYLTAQSQSTENTVATIRHEDVLISFLMDAQSPPDSSYVASSIGVSSECSSVDSKCQLNADDLTYNCSTLSIQGAFAKPLSMTYAKSQDSSTDTVYWNTAISVKLPGSTLLSNLIPGEATITRDNSTLLRILGCSSRAYNVRFSYLNGGAVMSSVSPANATVTKLLFSPMFPGMIPGYAGFGHDLLATSVSTAAASAILLKPIEDALARAFDRTAIASAAGVVTKVSNMSGGGSSASLTVVPKAAVLLLVVADLAYAMLALTIGAMSLARLRRVPGADGRVRRSSEESGATGSNANSTFGRLMIKDGRAGPL